MLQSHDRVITSQQTNYCIVDNNSQEQDTQIKFNISDMEGDVDNMRTDEACEDMLDPENASTTSSSSRRHRKTKRPLVRRIWSYIKSAWSDVIQKKGKLNS